MEAFGNIIKKNKKAIYIFIFLFILLLLISCNKPIPFGLNLFRIEKSISYQRGSIKLINDNLYLRYVITGFDENCKGSEDLIFFFHGIGKNELQWIANDGFAKQFLNVVYSNPNFKNTTVVSISFGMASLIINDTPFPFNANLESIFINDVVPYFQKILNKHGKIYLMGHSLGGYNALSLGIRYPENFPVVVAISPFISPISPFDKSYEKKRNNHFILSKFIKKMLIYVFKDEEKWNEYNAYTIINSEYKKNRPYIIISYSEKELPEFSNSINLFIKRMKEEKINFQYFITPGSHRRPKIEKILNFLMKKYFNKNKEILNS